MKRAKAIIDELLTYPKEATIVLFAHGILHQYLIRALLQMEDQLHIHTRQENTCINWFTVTDDFTRINAIGDAHHLQELTTV